MVEEGLIPSTQRIVQISKIAEHTTTELKKCYVIVKIRKNRTYPLLLNKIIQSPFLSSIKI
jgi:hypothetical protein